MSDGITTDDLEDFHGEHRRVGVGHHFESYDDGERAVEPGDVVVFEDPDSGMHAGECEFIHQSTIVCYVKGVYAVDYDHGEGFSVELDTTGPVGRLPLGDAYTAVVTEDGIIGGRGDDRDTRNMASRLVDGDAEKYVWYEYHMGEDGVPEDLWDEYADSSVTGPGCRYCRGEGDDGHTRIERE